jgi:lipopolysaccharide export system protein LptC
VIGFTPALAPNVAMSLRPDRSRAYAQARRHSRFVRLFKVAIPTGAVLASALILTASLFNPLGRMGLTLGPISMSGTKVAMQSPRLTGFKKDARPYEVTATAAYQDIRKPNVIELKEMRARLVMDEAGNAAHLTSKTGIFDSQKESLELSEAIRVTTDKGEEALLKSASVDFKTGSVVSNEPVKLMMTSGQVEADTMQIRESGKTITFVGRVHATFQRDGKGAQPAAADTAAQPKLSQAEPSARP